MKTLKYIIAIAVFLHICACSFYCFDFAVDGECLCSFSNLPKDSVYALMACYRDNSRRHDARIEQWIKPTNPFILKAKDITISYKDSLNLEFQMQDVWGDRIDSILISKPTLIVFTIKRVTGIHYPSASMAFDSTLLTNPYVSLIENIAGSGNPIEIKFDFNKEDVALFDNRCDEIYFHYIDTGRSPVIPYYRYFKGLHIPRYTSFSYDDSVRKVMKNKRKTHKHQL